MTNSNDALRAALEKSVQGWDNAIEMGLLPRQHHFCAQIMADEGRAALALTPSPVAGGDLRELAAKVAEGNVMSGNDQWAAGHDAAARKIAHAIRSLPLS